MVRSAVKVSEDLWRKTGMLGLILLRSDDLNGAPRCSSPLCWNWPIIINWL